MIDMKQAVQIAKEKAADMLDEPLSSVEEIERETYKGREVWSITLSTPQDLRALGPLERIGGRWKYRRFLIDVEAGEFLAMKVREVASP